MSCNGSGRLECYCAGDHCACGCPPECPGCVECAPEPDAEVRCAQLEAELADVRRDAEKLQGFNHTLAARVQALESSMVSAEGLRRLCRTYDDRLGDSAGICRANLARPVRDAVYAMAHVRWMLSVMSEMDDPGKANRWLGFVQGVMFAVGAFSIDDMRRHVTEGRR